MAKKTKGRQYKCDFGAVNLGDRAAAITLEIGLNEKDPAGQVGETWETLRKRRLIGRILLGDDMPSQKNFTDREVIEGAFDTGNPSFKDDTFTLRVTFDKSEISTEKLSHFAKKTGWIQIDSITAIPVKTKEDTQPEDEPMLWTTVPVAALGISDDLVNSIFNAGIKTLGRLVKVIKGDDAKFDKLAAVDGVTAARAKTVKTKVNQYFKTQGTENPLTA